MSPAPFPRTVAEAIREATTLIGVDWARDDAEMLMAHALGVTRSAMLLGHMRDPAPASFAAMLARRLKHEPVAYILGETGFYGRRFTVTPNVLIPRGDSETVIAAALEASPTPRRVLDCGVGSGCLLLTILAERPGASGIGIDRSSAAVAVASANAASLSLSDRTELQTADWTQPGWSAELGRFDLILANPPYVEDTAEIDASVRDNEPAGALFAGPDGLDAYRLLIPQLPALLTADGVAVFEIGYRQAPAVSAIAVDAGFETALRRDLADRPRVLIISQKGLAKRC